MGHLTRMANSLVQSTEKGPNVWLLGNMLKDMPENEQVQWEKFISGSLTETNKKNTVDLVNTHNLHSSSDDEESDLKEFSFPQEASLQQAFMDYQVQQMTSTFIDHFGFNDEEFGEQEESVKTEPVASQCCPTCGSTVIPMAGLCCLLCSALQVIAHTNITCDMQESSPDACECCSAPASPELPDAPQHSKC